MPVALAVCLLPYAFLSAQPWNDKTLLSRQDTLRGSVTAERKWWDLLHYDLRIKPDFATRTIRGHNTVTYRVVERTPKATMQLDLQPPLQIDSVRYDGKASVSFTSTG
ncbi:MAG: M1 family peptidase, partial [Cytophagales bacterium]|nr:M1 family peptidase [Cytophagales bacterium]